MNSFRIAEMAKPYLEHDMIQTYTELPEFPEYRTRLLFAFLDRDRHDDTDNELFALVTSLVQMGLDTHDLVSVTNEKKEKAAARSRQLKVLAGDYFSSRFYNLLSQAGQIDMIRQLSTAICEVNRLKVNLYTRVNQLKMTAEDYIQHSVGIKMQLFLSFQRLMDGIRHRMWPDVLQGYTRCEVLSEEMLRSESPNGFKGGWAYWYVLSQASRDERKQLQADEPDPAKWRNLMHKYNVTAQLYQMFEQQLESLGQKASLLDSDKLIQELRQIRTVFTRCVARPRVLEEL